MNRPVAYLRADLMGAARARSTAAVISNAKSLLAQAHSLRLKLEPRGQQGGPVMRHIHNVLNEVHSTAGLSAEEFDPLGGEWTISSDRMGLVSSHHPSYIFAWTQGTTSFGRLSTTDEEMQLMCLSISAYQALSVVVSPHETIEVPALIRRLDQLLDIVHASIDGTPPPHPPYSGRELPPGSAVAPLLLDSKRELILTPARRAALTSE